MKRIWLLLTVIVFVFALGACVTTAPDDSDPDLDPDPTGPSEAELLAQAFISNWSGDLTALSSMLDTMMEADSFEITTELYAEEYHPLFGETIVHIVSTDKYVFLADSVLLQRQMVMNLEGQLAEMNVIVVETMNGVIVYFDAASFFDAIDPMVFDRLTEIFDIHSDWIRLEIDDSLVNMLEFEVLSQFIQAQMLDELLGDIESLDDVETMLLDLLGIEGEAANLRLQVLFDTLFEGDINAVVAHLLDIDAERVVEGFLDNVLGAELVDGFYFDENELRSLGFDFDTYVPMLETEGFRATLLALTEAQAIILGDYYYYPILAIKEAFEQDDVFHALIMMFLDEAELDLRELEGFDYDLAYDVLSTMDFAALHAELALYDFNAHFESLLLGYYLEYYRDLPESELKTFFGLLNDLVIPNMGELAIVFEFNTLLEDLVRFDPYFDLNYFGSHEDVNLTIGMTDSYDIITTMVMSPVMLEAFATEFFGDVWHWLNQLEAIDFPEVNPISCEAGPCEEWHEFFEFFEMIQDDLVVNMIHNPADLSTVHFHLDLIEWFDGFTGGQSDLLALELNVTVKTGATINVPQNTFSLNDALEDVSKVIMAEDIYDFLVSLEGVYDLEEGIHLLSDFGRESERYAGVFDLELSYIEVTPTGNIVATFYYLDGSLVFETVYDLHAVRALTENEVNRTSILAIIGLFDAETYHLTRFLILFLGDVDWNTGGDDPVSYWFGYYPPHIWWWGDVDFIAPEEMTWYLYIYDRHNVEASHLRWTMLDFWMYSSEMVYFVDLDDISGTPILPVISVPTLLRMEGSTIVEIIVGNYDIDAHVWPLIDYHGGGDPWESYWHDENVDQLYWWEDIEVVAPQEMTWYLFVYTEGNESSDGLRYQIIDLVRYTDEMIYVIDINNVYDEATLNVTIVPTLFVMFGDDIVQVIEDEWNIYSLLEDLIWE